MLQICNSEPIPKLGEQNGSRHRNSRGSPFHQNRNGHVGRLMIVGLLRGEITRRLEGLGAPHMSAYRYTDSGLDNVIVEGIAFLADDSGEECVMIRNINGLHKAIAHGIVNRRSSISGSE